MNDNLSAIKWMTWLGLCFLNVAIWNKAFGSEDGRAEAALENTVKVCAWFERGISCGTGVFYSKNMVMSEAHIVSDAMNDMGAFQAAVILRPNRTTFEFVPVISRSDELDLAVLGVRAGTPAKLSGDFQIGDTVTVIGNPTHRDFDTVTTTVVAVVPLKGKDGIVNMIAVDDRRGEITHGFSGGGVFAESGVIGEIELCSPKDGICLAIPSSVLKTQIERTK